MNAILTDREPAYEHDGGCCVFVGVDEPREHERRVNQVDMYICLRRDGYHALIRRYSSEPADYGCSLARGLIGGPGAKYLRVLRAAKERGLI